MIKQLPKIYSIYDRLDTHGLETPNVGESLMNEILDQLPKEYWSNPWVKFFDPCTNRGVFLWAIFSRLDEGLKNIIPDVSKRRKHIVEKQLWGMERSESSYDTAYATFARSRYPLKNLFNEDFSKGMPKELKNMKFDVIIGNPPYQESDGGGKGSSAVPIYPKFIDLSKQLDANYISFIIPARWFVGGKGLNEFRKEMLNDSRISKMTVYPDSKECFPDNHIEGGVCHFLWNRNNNDIDCLVTLSVEGKRTTQKRKLNEHGEDIFISHPLEVSILEKITKQEIDFLEKKISSRKPFGIDSTFKSKEEAQTSDKPIKLYQTKSIGYISRDEVIKNHEWIDNWKVLVPKARGNQKGTTQLILGKPIVASPKTACTETYLVVDMFDNQSQAENLAKYVKTKFFRFMVSIVKKTQNSSKSSYRFVPDLDTTKVWTDEELYSRYDLTEEEINFIEKGIKKID